MNEKRDRYKNNTLTSQAACICRAQRPWRLAQRCCCAAPCLHHLQAEPAFSLLQASCPMPRPQLNGLDCLQPVFAYSYLPLDPRPHPRRPRFCLFFLSLCPANQALSSIFCRPPASARIHLSLLSTTVQSGLGQQPQRPRVRKRQERQAPQLPSSFLVVSGANLGQLCRPLLCRLAYQPTRPSTLHPRNVLFPVTAGRLDSRFASLRTRIRLLLLLLVLPSLVVFH
ncbi:hypothetical protein HDV63DRAFT_355873 [Trichoderma sp. SZMC 28014]